MKLRALLLCTLMVVVPLLAMFSHWIPAEVRAAARRHVWDSAGYWLGAPAEAGLAAPTASTVPTVAAAAAEVPSAVPPAEGRPVASGAPLPLATPAAAGLRPVVATEGRAPGTVEPALVAQLADRSRQTRDHHAIESRLRTLGAIAFECQPAPGGGLYASSCRVPVDATGQLQRVFQATGHDPAAATEALVEQVQQWRLRADPPLPPAVER